MNSAKTKTFEQHYFFTYNNNTKNCCVEHNSAEMLNFNIISERSNDDMLPIAAIRVISYVAVQRQLQPARSMQLLSSTGGSLASTKLCIHCSSSFGNECDTLHLW